jgi:tetratricopeptide (TPR) repeat protein
MILSRDRRVVPGIVFVGLAVLASPHDASAQTTAPLRVLVMPFETGADARTWWLGEGSSVLLGDDLRVLGVEAIGRDERLRAFGRLQVPPVASLSHGTVIRIGQLVGASAVIIGSIHTDGGRLEVRARSLRLDTGRLQGEVEEHGSLEDVFDVYERVARRLTSAPALLGSEQVRRPVPTPAAFESYVKGLLADTPAGQAAFLERAIALYPGYDDARLALWRAYTEAAQHEQALAAALSVTPQSPLARRARFAAAYSETALMKYDDAFERLRVLGEEAPAAEIANNMGVIQLRRGGSAQNGRATYWFTRATQGTPEPDYFFNLGYAYWFEQDVPAAIYWLREALRRNPADGDAHVVLGAALQVTGSAGEAARELELAQRLSTRDQDEGRSPGDRVPRGLERVRSTIEPAGATSAETTLAATGQREKSEVMAFHLERGRRLFDAQRDAEAIDELRRALYLSPYLAEAHLLLGRIYLRGGRTNEAIEALKISIWSEETAAAHEVLADAWLQSKDTAAARREAERALAIDPRSETARRLLAELPAR